MPHSDATGLRRHAGSLYRWALRTWHGARRLTPIRHVRAMQLRRLEPLAAGKQRGEPVVRYYWARFLEAHREDVRGHAVEVGDTMTLRRYGGDRVTTAEALDIAERRGVSIVADLSRADHVPADTYDCFVMPFTAHLIYDIEAALYHAIRILKPGGVLLANFSCVDYNFANGLDMGTGRPLFVFWSFTPLQVENLLRRIGLAVGDFDLRVDGNLFARIAYQANMPVEELTPRERDHPDPGHPLLISVRVMKPQRWSAARPAYREAWTPDTSPATWNPRTGHYPSD